MAKSKCPECEKVVPFHYNFTSHSGVFCDRKCCEKYESKHKEDDFIYLKTIEKGYTKEEFIKLDNDKLKEFSEALSLREFARLQNSVKYLYSNEANVQIEAIASFLAE